MHVPPLRERPEAIVPLIYHFLEKYNKRFGFSKQMDPEVVEVLTAHHWPGNVRELENAIERMVVVTAGDVISEGEIPEAIKRPAGRRPLPTLSGRSLKEIIEEVEATAITEALKTHGSTRKAAQALGINQSTVVRKATRYGISSNM